MKPQQYPIQELVHKALIGDLVLPDIQRDFVWSTDRITELLDSLMREFPFGSLLFWETRFHEVQYRNFERDYRSNMRFTTKEKPMNEPKVMVLDGQQRLQSLIIALAGSLDGKKCYFDLLSGPSSNSTSETEELPEGFDFHFLSDRQYKFYKTSAESELPENGAPAHIWIQVSQVMSWEQRYLVKLAKDFCEKNHDAIDSEDGSLISENVQGLYLFVWGAARVTAVTVDEACYEPSMARKLSEVLEIFKRVNSGGMTLSMSDLMFSIIKSKWPGARTAFDDLTEELSSVSDFGLDKNFIIKCLLTVIGADPKYDVEVVNRRMGEIRDAFPNCSRAIKSTVDFVKNEALLTSRRVLTGNNVLIPIVNYLFWQPNQAVPPEERKKLTHFLYLGLYNGFFSKYADPRIRFIRRYIEKSPAPFPLENTIYEIQSRQLSASTEVDEDLLSLNVTLTLNVVQRKFFDPLTSRAQIELDHIFPVSRIRGIFPDDLVDHFANRCFLEKLPNIDKSDTPPDKYFGNESAERLLELYQINKALLDKSRFEEFLADRKERIIKKVRAHLGVD